MGKITDKIAARRALTLYFTTLAVAFVGGGGAYFYANNQQATVLSEAYADAAQCDIKKKTGQACTKQELTSIAKKQANEKIKEAGQTSMVVSAILTFL